MVKLVYPELADNLLLSTGISAGLNRDESEIVLIMMRFDIVVGADEETAWNFILAALYSGCGECSGLETTFISTSGSCDDIIIDIIWS